MLTIITGTPGAGKTLYSLHRLKKDFRDNVPEEKRRPIYINGVPEVDLDYLEAEHLEDPAKWYECPKGSIIFIDEAQRVFPQRTAQVAVPKKCRKFETHRHDGFDVFVTTQDANTLDVHLRRLAGRHFHVKRNLGQEVASIYEYDHYQKDPTDHFNKKDAIAVKSWRYDKSLYGIYKSAEIHTVKKRYPFKLFLIPIAIAAIIALITFGINTLKGEVNQVTDPGSETDVVRYKELSGPAARNITLPHYEYHKPKVPGLLHTSPFYGEVFEAKTFPKPYCITYQVEPGGTLNAACKCLTQQATTYATDDKTCRYWAKHGFFDPTIEERDDQQQGAAYVEQAAPLGLSGRYNY